LTSRSYLRTAGILKSQLIPTFGKLQISKIRRPDVTAFVTTRKGEVRADTMLKELGVLTHFFSWAIEQELLNINPCRGVKRPKTDKGRTRYLQPGELRLILTECPAWLRPIVGLLCFTGMRRSELLTLRWVDVDRRSGFFLLPTSKNGEPRCVHLNDLAKGILDALPKNSGEPLDRVFPASEQISPENVSLSFLRAARRAGVANIRLHDLRHTFASWLRMKGADLHTVGMLLGHKDPRMTARYATLSPVFLQTAVKGLDVAFGAELANMPMLNAETPSHDGRTIEHQNVPKLIQASAS
jgi:integrase